MKTDRCTQSIPSRLQPAFCRLFSHCILGAVHAPACVLPGRNNKSCVYSPVTLSWTVMYGWIRPAATYGAWSHMVPSQCSPTLHSKPGMSRFGQIPDLNHGGPPLKSTTWTFHFFFLGPLATSRGGCPPREVNNVSGCYGYPIYRGFGLKVKTFEEYLKIVYQLMFQQATAPWNNRDECVTSSTFFQFTKCLTEFLLTLFLYWGSVCYHSLLHLHWALHPCQSIWLTLH